jgi:ParB/RepB/Spo0J family partition protein
VGQAVALKPTAAHGRCRIVAKQTRGKKTGEKAQKPTGGKIVRMGEIPTDKIYLSDRFNRKQIQKSSDEFKALVASIAEIGIVQPIVVREGKRKGTFELIAGERRYHAAKALKLKTMTAVIRRADPVEAGGVQLVENMHRQDLTPFEEALQLKGQVDKGVSTDELAAKLGKVQRFVQRRISICKLSKRWMDVAKDPKMCVGYWTALLLERVAKMRPKMQDKLLAGFYPRNPTSKLRISRENGIWIPTTQELDRRISNLTKDIGTAPWDKDQSGVAKGVGPCSSCKQRSSQDPSLWDTKKGVDLCLDADCWNKKTGVVVQQKFKAAKKEHGNCLKLTEDWQTHWNSKGKIERANSYDECKQTAKGAVPAVHVDGPLAGHQVFVRPRHMAHGSGGSSSSSSHKPKVRPLSERKRELHQKRAKIVRDELCSRVDNATLDNFCFNKGAGKRASLVMLVAHLGVSSKYWHADWKDYDDVFAGNCESSDKMVWNDLCSTFNSVVRREWNANSLGNAEDFDEDTKRIAGFVGVDISELWAEAAVAHPTPSTWAKEEADLKAKEKAKKSKSKSKAGKKAKPK